MALGGEVGERHPRDLGRVDRGARELVGRGHAAVPEDVDGQGAVRGIVVGEERAQRDGQERVRRELERAREVPRHLGIGQLQGEERALRRGERVAPLEAPEDHADGEDARRILRRRVLHPRFELGQRVRPEGDHGVDRREHAPLEEPGVAPGVAEERRALHADHRDLFEALARALSDVRERRHLRRKLGGEAGRRLPRLASGRALVRPILLLLRALRFALLLALRGALFHRLDGDVELLEGLRVEERLGLLLGLLLGQRVGHLELGDERRPLQRVQRRNVVARAHVAPQRASAPDERSEPSLRGAELPPGLAEVLDGEADGRVELHGRAQLDDRGVERGDRGARGHEPVFALVIRGEEPPAGLGEELGAGAQVDDRLRAVLEEPRGVPELVVRALQVQHPLRRPRFGRRIDAGGQDDGDAERWVHGLALTCIAR